MSLIESGEMLSTCVVLNKQTFLKSEECGFRIESCINKADQQVTKHSMECK